MGRGGIGDSDHSSSSHSSISHSSSGHRSGSSSGRGHSSGGRGGISSGSSSDFDFSTSSGSNYSDSAHASPGLIVIAILFLLGLPTCIIGFKSGGFLNPIRCLNREPLTDAPAYVQECVFDGDDWFYEDDYLSSRLEEFYDATGIQPYVVTLPYSKDWNTKAEREAWLDDFWDDYNIADNSMVLLCVAGWNSNNKAKAVLRVGDIAATLMDSKAQRNFWKFYNYYYDDEELSDTFFIIHTFEDTVEMLTTSGIMIRM